MAYGLAALSGLLNGLGGLNKGMAEGTAADQRQQQINLQERQLEEGRSTDLSAIAPILKAAGMNLPEVPGGRVPNTILPTLLAQQQKQADAAKVDALRSVVPEQARPFLGVPGGPELYKMLHGGETQKPQIVGENARGYLKGDQFTPFPTAPEPPVPPGLVPHSMKSGGITYQAPGAPKEGPQPTIGGDVVKTLNELGITGEKRLDKLKSHMVPEGGQLIGSGTGQVVAQGPAKTQPLSAGETGNLADTRSLVGRMDAIADLQKPGFVGPMQGRLGALRTQTGIGASAPEATFRSAVAELSNELLKLRSGAAVTPQEYTRIQAELPQANDPEVVFKAKLARARTMLQQALDTREAEFAAKGFRGVAPQAPINPAVPLGQQPTVQEAGQRLRGALDSANGLPGVPPAGGGAADPREGTVSKSGKYVWKGGKWQPR